MPLTAGTRLGPYEVVAPLGAGGMGEVYRARDTRLGRTVAVKVLLASATASTESRRRFEQEARAASALNHPNVVVLHDIGDHGGAPYVVTELLEGTTVRALLAQGALPLSRAVAIGTDVAHGLAAAHDRGIVHRDVKPENLFVTKDGRVKILDFGVATFIDRPGVEALETMASPSTEPGVVLGTVGYMAPEQVRGERVDARADVFALGVVLYEMLAGRRPFTGASKVETLHAILTASPPDLADPPGTVPPSLARVVGHCLEKDPATRFQAARDVAFALEGAGERGSTTGTAVIASRARPGRGAWAAGLGLALLAVLGAFAARYASRATPADWPDVRFEIPAPDNGMLQGILGISSAVSPDGTTIALAVTTETGNRLYLRHLSTTTPVAVEDSEGALNPFWSPDSRSVAFFTPGRLKRVRAAGGPPQTIWPVGSTFSTVGTWSPNDTIVIAGATSLPAGTPPGAFLTIPASGGQAPVVMQHTSRAPMGWPSMLPDGRHFLFVTGGPQGTEVRVGALDSGESTLVTHAESRALYAPPGYLLFVRDATLLAQRFDLHTLKVEGTPVGVADGLLYFRPLGVADFSVSDTGMLVYQAGNTASRLVWYARNGLEQGQVGPPADYFFLRLSPSGQQVAADVMDRHLGTTDIQLFDLRRGGQPTAVTSDGFVDWTPVFSPDEQQIAFASNRRGPPHVHVKRLTESGNGTELVAPTQGVQFVTDWTTGPGGQFIVFNDELPDTKGDVFMAPLDGSHAPQSLVQTRANEADGRVSPDGRWLAYVSAESGRAEVYVRALHGSAERWQVSTGGGLSPRWRRDGAELYFVAATSMQPFAPAAVLGVLTAVPIKRSGVFEAGVPVPLFSVRARQGQYEPSTDGTRFLVNSGKGVGALPITVSTNWLRTIQ